MAVTVSPVAVSMPAEREIQLDLRISQGHSRSGGPDTPDDNGSGQGAASTATGSAALLVSTRHP
jgi:hypothetical protein